MSAESPAETAGSRAHGKAQDGSQSSLRTRKHKPWCHLCPPVLLFLIASALEDSAGPTLQAGRVQHCQDVGKQRREGVDRYHHPGTQAFGRPLMGQSSAEAQVSDMLPLGSETKRKESEQPQWDVAWGSVGTTCHVPLVKEEGRRKVMSCSRAIHICPPAMWFPS